ncbi:MAG: PHP domain-containing protein [Methylobacteriaceae bacterium]|nr:PHP domain-containing protein [Methylobacteriaceae bacterium]
MNGSLAAFAAPGRFWRGNLHTHSTLSDGRLPPDQVIAAYRAQGYDFLQLSEHFLARFDWPIADTRGFRESGFTTLLGAELHAPGLVIGELWHILAAGLPADFAPAGEREDGPALARRAREAGAFVAIAHPAWSQLVIEDGRALEAAHAVEVYNHSCAVECDRADGFYLLDRLLSEGRRLSACATDDAHFAHGDRDAFGGWVQVKAQTLDPDALVAALKRGDYYSSMGPAFHDVRLEGDMLHVDCSPVDTIAVMGAGSRTVTRVGRAITSASLDLSRLRKGWMIGIDSAWLRVALIDSAGRRAWTNPFWPNETG